ncbi:ABC transporter ATP-binding protein [Streptomyces albipurpureus]|uniref:ATP-binding cassette domain-containing protein n=1 Tax=Streptomyces albipurpureus TaxID=2897419 RepID=A0ABT0ULG3_9ACTN|nr:ATP-binding cassette domain-containing protein [Streptomyces sp. CWNU-1]MCM2389452.1 ATP-binding cassette domain-containing protein [Streptomyces sp. CWNU-1]
MTEAALQAIGMSAGYHGVAAVSDIDLEVHAGEVVALLGPNGAGKTTTIRACAGQIGLLGGHVRLNGSERPGPLFKRIRGGMGLLTESRCVFMGLTVRENLRLGRGPMDDALAHFPELERRLDVRAGLISGGEQQMLALARILAARPNVLIADELSLGLAPLIVRRLLDALTAAAVDGAAVLIVEQQTRLALESAQRAYVLRRGKMALSGPVAELRAQSAAVAELYL